MTRTIVAAAIIVGVVSIPLFTWACGPVRLKATNIDVAAIVPTDKSAEKSEQSAQADPWVGKYLKFGRYEGGRSGQFNEAPEVTISRIDGGYQLSKPWEVYKFEEIKPGILKHAGIGTIQFSKTEFPDGKHARVLRCNFCYESFILYDLDE